MKKMESLNLIEQSANTKSKIVRGHNMLRSANSAFFKPTLLELDRLEENKWYDIFEISDFNYEKNGRIAVDAFLSLEYPSPDITVSGMVMNKKTQAVIYELPPVKGHETCHVSYHEDFTASADSNSALCTEDIYVVLKAVYSDPKAGTQEVNRVEKLTYRASDYMKYDHKRPRKEPSCLFIEDLAANKVTEKEMEHEHHEKTGDHIVISYKREPKDVRDCDYVCNFGVLPSTQTDTPRLGIPFKGELQLFRGLCFASDISTECYIVRLGSTGGARKLEYKTRFENKFLCRGEESVLMEMNAWNIPYEEEGNLTPVNYQYYQRLDMTLDDRMQMIPISAMITSDKGDLDALCNEVLPLTLMWGCVEENALVLMADGGLKKISNIQIGDMVMGESQKPVLVRNVWMGFEHIPCVKIALAGGSTLILTSQHPLRSEEKWLRAGEVREGDFLIAADSDGQDSQRVESAGSVRYEQAVYNLSLDSKGGGGFIANGMLVGDMERQNSILD